jgi:hypothetical protein
VSVTLTYDNTLSRVRIAATAMGIATTAVFERSVDQITWSTVRGGGEVAVVSGNASLDDYEFAADVVNYYRVTSRMQVSFVNAGTAAHADNAAVVPGLPAGIQAGDLMLCLAASRNTSVFTGGMNNGWTFVEFPTDPNVRLFGKIATASESAPTVSFVAGGGAGDTSSAQIAAFRGAFGPIATLVVDRIGQANASAQNIAYPALSVTEDGLLILYYGQKADDWTSVTSPGTEIGEPSSTLGNDQGLVWSWQNQGVAANIAAGSFTVTGGASAVSKGAVYALRPGDLVQTDTITPTLSSWWLKSVERPFLNTPIVPLKPVPTLETHARQGIFDIVGRSHPVAVTDVRSNKGFVLRVVAESDDERERIESILDAGDAVFFHTPADSPRPSMYAVIGDTSHDFLNDVFVLPLRKVAAPGPDVVGSTATWQTVINTYATWADVIAAKATWADLLELVGDPSEVIVP